MSGFAARLARIRSRLARSGGRCVCQGERIGRRNGGEIVVENNKRENTKVYRLGNERK